MQFGGIRPLLECFIGLRHLLNDGVALGGLAGEQVVGVSWPASPQTGNWARAVCFNIARTRVSAHTGARYDASADAVEFE
jgi:hypothetical protein